MPRLVAALALTAFVAALPSTASAQRTRDITPYKQFQFRYTTGKPATRTGFRYRVALDLPSDGSPPPRVTNLRLQFAKGTKIDRAAAATCPASDVELGAGGPTVCPPLSRIARGSASVYVGPGPLVELSATVLAARTHPRPPAQAAPSCRSCAAGCAGAP